MVDGTAHTARPKASDPSGSEERERTQIPEFLAERMATAVPFEVVSPLPEDGTGLQGDSDAGETGDHPRRVVLWRAGRRHSRTVDVGARSAGRLANALHLLPHWRAVRDAVGVKLDSHRIGVEILKIDLDLEDVLLATSLDLHSNEMKRRPLLS
jgi:hypothetical protein